MSNVVFIDDEWKRFANRLANEFRPNAIGIVNRSAQFAKRSIVEKLPRRTGQLRNSYQATKKDDLTWSVGSNLQYAESYESGSKAKTIYPKRAKRLTIPLSDDVLVSTKARIKKSALDNLFNQLKKPRGRSIYQIFQDAKIVLAKKADIPAQPGHFTIRDRIAPMTGSFMVSELSKTARELGFS